MRSSAAGESFIRAFEDVTTDGLVDAEPAVVPGGAVMAGEQVLSIEELARRFSVSTKTISRWRDHGLVAQRYTVDGRRRVGFLASAVERFIRENPLRIERGIRQQRDIDILQADGEPLGRFHRKRHDICALFDQPVAVRAGNRGGCQW